MPCYRKSKGPLTFSDASSFIAPSYYTLHHQQYPMTLHLAYMPTSTDFLASQYSTPGILSSRSTLCFTELACRKGLRMERDRAGQIIIWGQCIWSENSQWGGRIRLDQNAPVLNLPPNDISPINNLCLFNLGRIWGINANLEATKITKPALQHPDAPTLDDNQQCLGPQNIFLGLFRITWLIIQCLY